MELFWRSATWHEPSSHVQPRWGSVIVGHGPSHDHFAREMLLEAVRREVAPNSVSRLTATFTFLTEEQARAWDDERHLLYRVEPVREAAPVTQANMMTLDEWHRQHTFEEVWEWGRRYWLESPARDQLSELLVGGELRIVELLGDLRYPE